MNQTTSHLASRKEELYKMGGFYRQKGEKVVNFSQGHCPLGDERDGAGRLPHQC